VEKHLHEQQYIITTSIKKRLILLNLSERKAKICKTESIFSENDISRFCADFSRNLKKPEEQQYPPSQQYENIVNFLFLCQVLLFEFYIFFQD